MHKFQFNRNKLLAFCAISVLILCGLFLLRAVILRKVIASVSSKFNDFNYKVQIDGAKFNGLRTVYIKDILIQSQSDDNWLQVKSLNLKPRIFPLFIKKLRIKMLSSSSISIKYYYKDSLIIKNANMLKDTSDVFENENLAGITFKYIRRFFNYLPDKVLLDKINIRIVYAGRTTRIGLDNFKLVKQKINSVLVIKGDSSFVKIPVAGKIDKPSSEIKFTLTNSDSSLLPLPILIDKYGLETGFDSFNFSLDLSHRNRHMVSPEGNFSITRFELKSRRISTENIKINSFSSKYKLNIGSDYFEIDSSTVTRLNKIVFKQYLKVSTPSAPFIRFKILPQIWEASDFFSSLPQGMFTSLVGIKTSGLLNFHLSFSVDLTNPDSLFFDTKLTGKDFHISKYGIDDYRILNNSFVHRVYEKENRIVTTFTVGPENPDFVAFDQISPFLRAAVMTSEDGSFFYHNGFNSKAFRESIITNIKEKRFARGGSTISMQLVKNVFLTRNKTLARKIEEALIVWIIENKDIVSKQRMYEIYLNLIEWGPGIYGIGNASRFYFNKSAGNLDLQESVYLASIIPHPKWYRYSFETNGILKPFYSYYFNRLKELMVRREFILPSDTSGVKPIVFLKGDASKIFVSNDTSLIDSINIEDLKVIPVF